jgi:hypothetical protein
MKLEKNRNRTDHSGSSLDSFLEEEGLRAEVEAVTMKRVRARRLEEARRKQGGKDLKADRRVGHS